MTQAKSSSQSQSYGTTPPLGVGRRRLKRSSGRRSSSSHCSASAYLSSRFSSRWLQIHSYITSQCFYLHLNRVVDLKPPVGSEYFLPHYLETTFIQVKLEPHPLALSPVQCFVASKPSLGTSFPG